MALTTHQHDEITTIRGKSLSPPNLRPNRRHTITSNSSIYYNRGHQRYLIRPFNTTRRQKLLAKAKQVATAAAVAAVAAARQSPLPPSSPTSRTASAMGKTIAKIDLQTASGEDATTALKEQTNAEKPIDNEDKGNSSDSEYSSLEDDDDDNNQGRLMCENI